MLDAGSKVPTSEPKTLTPKTSLDLIEKFLARSNLALTLSSDNRIIGVRVANLAIPPAECKIDAIGDILRTTLKFYKGWQWFVAGLITTGLELSEDFAQLLPSDHTLTKWCSVYAHYVPSERCFDLPFSHYEEVCYVKDKRARANLLAQAVAKNWSVQELRTARNLDAGNPTPAISYEFTVFSGVSSALKLWNSGIIDKQQYQELVQKYGRQSLSIETKVLGAIEA